MSESRICPVCENEIPEDARYCPHCNFDLEILNYDLEILNYKESIESTPQYYLVGGVVGLFAGIMFPYVTIMSIGWTILHHIVWVMTGILIGLFIGYTANMLFIKANNEIQKFFIRIYLVLGNFIFSVIFNAIISNLLFF